MEIMRIEENKITLERRERKEHTAQLKATTKLISEMRLMGFRVGRWE